jgi:hypothetical protein
VPALPAGLVYVEIAAGGYHSVARRSDGLVIAWGRNNYSQCSVPLLQPGFSHLALGAADLRTVARLEGQPNFASFCEPGAAGVSACPCSNPPAAPGRGCDNSSATGGASLAAAGTASLAYDTLVLTTQGEKPSATSIVLQGSASIASGTSFGQGVRCVSGGLKRLYTKTAVGGSIRAPQTGDPSVSARSAALGDPINPGTHRFYQVYYRDPIVLGGCPATATFNATQAIDATWSP